MSREGHIQLRQRIWWSAARGGGHAPDVGRGACCRPPTPCCELSRLTGPARPTRLSASDRAKAVSGSAVLDSPAGRDRDRLSLRGPLPRFLSALSRGRQLRACPRQAGCSATPQAAATARRFFGLDADPSLTLDVGRRYLLKGGMRSEREMERSPSGWPNNGNRRLSGAVPAPYEPTTLSITTPCEGTFS